MKSNVNILNDRKKLCQAIKSNDFEIKLEIAQKYFIDLSKIEKIMIDKELLRKIDAVPISLVLAQAAAESGWGTSRFALEGNALFGVRTWDLEGTPHMKALGNMEADWGVKKYTSKCQSVKDMIRILNTHPAYEKFREARAEQLDDGKWDYRKLLSGMTAWSTNPDYKEIIIQTIVDNKLP